MVAFVVFRLAVDADVELSSSSDSSDDVAMQDVARTADQADDSGACCSHDALTPTAAGAAPSDSGTTPSDSSGSGSEDSVSAVSTNSSATPLVDNNTMAESKVTKTTTASCSAAMDEPHAEVDGQKSTKYATSMQRYYSVLLTYLYTVSSKNTNFETV